jgi:hypothetical protein
MSADQGANSDYAKLCGRDVGNREPRIYITYSAAPAGDTTDPIVTLNAPADASTDNDGVFDLNCTSSDNINLTNVTLYHNWTSWHANSTNSSGYNATDYLFNYNITNCTTLMWNCYACDNSSNCAFAAANYTLEVNVSCCVESLVNTSWTLGSNTTPALTSFECNTSDFYNYSHYNWTQENSTEEYDSNNCGRANITYYDNLSYSNTTYNIVCSYSAVTYAYPSFFIVKNLDLDTVWRMLLAYGLNIEVQGCVRYNCSQPGGCVTLGSCI